MSQPFIYDFWEGNNTNNWTQLVHETMENFRKYQMMAGFIAPDFMPILYFGDSEAYFRSPVRVVTVGLNPSDVEFPRTAPTKRFPYEHLDLLGPFDEKFSSDYRTILDRYFLTWPYKRWFDSAFGVILEEFGASYYPGSTITAIHTDIATPIPTYPTWSKIGKPSDDPYWEIHGSFKDTLALEGRRLFGKLVSLLQPDIMFASVGKEQLDNLQDAGVIRKGKAETVLSITHRKDGEVRQDGPYEVVRQRYGIAGSPHVMTVVSGQAAQTPFGSVSKKDKREIGRRTREWYEENQSEPD